MKSLAPQREPAAVTHPSSSLGAAGREEAAVAPASSHPSSLSIVDGGLGGPKGKRIMGTHYHRCECGDLDYDPRTGKCDGLRAGLEPEENSGHGPRSLGVTPVRKFARMRWLFPLILVVAACAPAAADTPETVAPVERVAPLEQVAPATPDAAEVICESFETLWLHEIVGVAETELDLSTVDALVLVGVVVATTCPEHIDMYVEELHGQYPSLVDAVTDGIEQVGAA